MILRTYYIEDFNSEYTKILIKKYNDEKQSYKTIMNMVRFHSLWNK